MAQNECLIHVDFSENWRAKFHKEIQSVHFGASQAQITLHTGVCYIGANAVPKTFCSVSDCCNHGPAAIWTHLKPVLDSLQKEHPVVDTCHFFSDGPTAQYKQKLNMFLFSNILAQRGIKMGTWNFHESGHGKGIPDGVGATVKRTADKIVLYGADITDARSLVDTIAKKTSIAMFLIDPSDIDAMEELVSRCRQKLPTIPGIMKIHQFTTTAPSQLSYRDVSCVCRMACDCFHPRAFKFPITLDKMQVDTKRECSATPPASQVPETPLARADYFSQLLKHLEVCTSFDELRKLALMMEQSYLFNLPQSPASLDGIAIDVDHISLALLPDDLATKFMPIVVSADGNCLPHSMSMLCFGHERYADEMRAGIVVELAAHEETYLDPAHLRRGIDVTDKEADKLRNSFCLYSGVYREGRCSFKVVQQTFRNEVLEVRKKDAYMGIWQLMALSSVLGADVFSVYLDRGNPSVRRPASMVDSQREKVRRQILHPVVINSQGRGQQLYSKPLRPIVRDT